MLEMYEISDSVNSECMSLINAFCNFTHLHLIIVTDMILIKMALYTVG